MARYSFLDASVDAKVMAYEAVVSKVDLPVEDFLPQVGVQASLLFLQRKFHEEKLMTDPPD